ncbi:SET domain-containing protein [Phanerochaete sordida]|uniref:SET domain-containing protein n=1 Tax=Phanerochaete sordida TaxID=48140 RepID=A0A9P3LE09_9APHY|nr:SET domain-containing protein [Phanerochaete sordida]
MHIVENQPPSRMIDAGLSRDFYVHRDASWQEFSASLRTNKRWKAGDVLGPVRGTKSPRKYDTVQCGPSSEDNITVDSIFVYVNHSCDPNVAFDMSSKHPSEWHIRALKAIDAEEELTFFYPSTEWELDQPFECRCASPMCLGLVRGARDVGLEQIKARGYVSPWIIELFRDREERVGA